MIRRSLESLLLDHHFPSGKMAFVVGPRQVGKTTLARRILEVRGSPDLYFNWDDLTFRRGVSRAPYGFADAVTALPSSGKPLLVLDEIHKFPRWKSYLKGLWDTRSAAYDILVTGSGRLDVHQRGGDSLLGRYHQYRLHPLSVREVLSPAVSPASSSPESTLDVLLSARGEPPRSAVTAFESLFRWGGFPEVYLERNPASLRLWHADRKRLIVREDLRDLTRIQLVSHVEEMVELLAARAAGVLSYNALREDLQVALDSVRLWTEALIRLYYIYLVRPYAKRIARAIRREPKVYLWDWSEIEDDGRRFENLTANHLLKWCHFTRDFGLEPLELFYVRDKEKREVDFLLTKGGTPWLLVEAKLGASAPGPALGYFGDRLGVRNRFLIVADLKKPGIAGDVRILDATSFFAALPV
ncbi:MAG: ATP-binding protein [Candidatus Aminicenantes bacterium]|nr:ATP-binding protein [Candidatus Aminicenantes bacterium]